MVEKQVLIWAVELVADDGVPEVREVHPSLTEFVTHLCAVLGGVFTTMGLIDGFFFYSTRALTKKTM